MVSICMLNNKTYLIYFSTGYVQDLMDELLEVCDAGETSSPVAVPDFLCSEFERPDKKIAVMHKQSRFANSASN